MRRLIGRRRRAARMVAAVSAAFLVAGIAFAATRADGGSEAAKASYSLKLVGKPDTRICQGADGSYEQTIATYTGPVTGRPTLMNGQLTFTIKIVMNLDKKLGFVVGSWTLDDPAGVTQWRGRLLADVPQGSDLDGFIYGNLSNSTRALFGALQGVLAEDRTAVIGRIGDLTPPNRAVIVPTSPC